MIVSLASRTQVKIDAVKNAIPKEWDVNPLQIESKNCEQPWGLTEIRQCAENRLKNVKHWPCVSLETGIIPYENDYQDVTCCLLKTRYGTFETWSEPVLHKVKHVKKWLKLPEEKRHETTVASLAYPSDKCHDWYLEAGYYKSRREILRNVVIKAFQQWTAARMDMPAAVIPASTCNYRGVSFLDVQDSLLHSPRTLSLSVRRLADRLLFDTVVAIDARGFLLVGEFLREGFPVVMARKPGKLPNNEERVDYKKEYESDSICITKNSIKPRAKVIIIDDLIATGGSMMAVEELVKRMGASVVAFIAPFAIETNSKSGLQLLSKFTDRLRFHTTKEEASSGNPWPIWSLSVLSHYEDYVDYHKNPWLTVSDLSDIDIPPRPDILTITPPSLRYITANSHKVPVRWGRHYWSSNIWFSSQHVKNEQVLVFLDPTNAQEMSDVLQLLSILYRKDPRRVQVVIPFLDQSTQDRVEFETETNMESVAAVDTISKLLGKFVVHTFDLHAEQSRLIFYDLRFTSLVKLMWDDYHAQHPNIIPVFPDAGAAKRFGRILNIENPITFRKIRKGEERIVTTDGKIKQGQSYVIIDDLVRSGGTMAAVCKYLKDSEAGAQYVDALFAHAPLEPKACRNLADFREIWTSDSCPRLVPSHWVKIRVLDALFQSL